VSLQDSWKFSLGQSGDTGALRINVEGELLGDTLKSMRRSTISPDIVSEENPRSSIASRSLL